MSASTFEERRFLPPNLTSSEPDNPRRFRVRRSAVHGVNRLEQGDTGECDSMMPISDDEELAFVWTCMWCLAALAMAPLILFFFITFFYPDLFLLPITPR